MPVTRPRARRRFIRKSLTAAVAFVASAGLSPACSDPNPGDPNQPLPLPSTAPLLSCEEAVEGEGSCHRAADCGKQICRAAPANMQDDRSPLVLTCGEPLGSGQNRDRCADGEDCETGICGLSDVCLIPCAKSGDCVEGQACRRVEARLAEGLAPVMACARTLAFSEDVAIATATETMVAGEAVTALSIPRGDENALVYLYFGCEAQGEIHALRNADSDEVWFDLSELLAGRGSDNPLLNTGQLIPALIPNNPALVRGKDVLEFDVYSDLASDVRLVSVSRTGEHEVLELNVYYVGGGEESSPGGLHPGSPELRAILKSLDDRLRPHALRLGEIREHDVEGDLRDELAVLETEIVRDEQGNAIDLEIKGLDQLFALSAGSDDGGVNLFLVSDMGDVLGISGGIPGALGVSGTAASGVALAVDVVGLDELAGVMLHELSHQLGLFHTSELNGSVIEPLEDTPECRPDRDENGDRLLVGAECVGAGADNLMFWAGTGTEISDQQAEVLRRSPVLR